MLLTRGSGNLSVLTAGQVADPAALAGTYVRQVLAPNAQGLILSQSLQTIRLGGGQVGVRFAYQGTFRWPRPSRASRFWSWWCCWSASPAGRNAAGWRRPPPASWAGRP